MKRLATVFALSVTVLLSGCSGAPGPAPTSTFSTTPPPVVPPPTPTPVSPAPPPVPPPTPNPVPPPVPDITGNWQFSAASTVPGKPPFTFAGSISQAGSTVSGALHVDGSTCFNRLTTMGLTGTVTADNTSLTSTALDGQVVTFTGNFTNATFTGTYSISGGCDAGDKGSVTGINIYIGDADSWGGIFTSSTQTKFTVSGNFAQNTTASSQGSFGITGTATFDTPCFSAATLSPGSFPSGSFILGTLVSLEIKTDNGTVAFLGTVDPLTEYMSGTYSVVGGTCDQTGTAVLVLTGQWDY